jgi:hypothetical protein
MAVSYVNSEKAWWLSSEATTIGDTNEGSVTAISAIAESV